MDGYLRLSSLPVGIGTDLMVHLDGVEGRLRSSLVGIKIHEYLIIETPKMVGIESKLFEQNKVTVIFIYSGVVYGFKSFILNSITNPSRLLFITFPEESERQDLRGSQRVECYIPSIARLAEDDLDYRGIILDISPGGCRYSTTEVARKKRGLFQPQAKVNLYFQLLGMEGTQTFNGEIQTVNQDERRVSFGVRFEGVDDDIITKIEAYVKNVTEHLL